MLFCAPASTERCAGEVQIQFYGLPGQKYLLQASTDMVNWVTLTTTPMTMGSTGVATYRDKNAARYSHQFYRVVPTP